MYNDFSWNRFLFWKIYILRLPFYGGLFLFAFAVMSLFKIILIAVLYVVLLLLML